MSHFRSGLLVALAVFVLTPSVVAAAGTQAPAGVFVSLVPACACGRHTSLVMFSRMSGRRIRTVTSLVLTRPGDQSVSLGPATDRGRLFLTVTTGARCVNTQDMECPRWIPDSCSNTVQTLSPGQSTFSTLFTVRGSESLGDVVPDPAGNQVALTMTPCVSVHGTTSLFVRNLRSGRMRTILTSRNRCDGFAPAGWNQAGTELAFVLNRADGRPIPIAGGFACPSGRDSIALARLNGANASRELTLISPDRGCAFHAAAFDADGIVADEGCNQHSPPNEGRNYLGQAILVQYNARGQAMERTPLALGLSDSVIAAVPHTGKVLITQDQPANSGYPERDWVWQLNGHHLRLIAHYPAHDSIRILAIPW